MQLTPGDTLTVTADACPTGMVAISGWVNYTTGATSDIAMIVNTVTGPSPTAPGLPSNWAWHFASSGSMAGSVTIVGYEICAP